MTLLQIGCFFQVTEGVPNDTTTTQPQSHTQIDVLNPALRFHFLSRILESAARVWDSDGDRLPSLRVGKDTRLDGEIACCESMRSKKMSYA